MGYKLFTLRMILLLTCVVQGGVDDAGDSPRAELGDPIASLHGEGVVQMWLKFTNGNTGLLQLCVAGLIAHLLSTGLTHIPFAAFTRYTVGDVGSSSCVGWGSPG